MLTQWFDPEPGPARLPGALARSLVSRGHEVKVLTGFPNYPDGKIYSGYRQAWRHNENWNGIALRRTPLIPSHSESVAGRLLNYGSFGASAMMRGVSHFDGVDALWVSNSPVTVGLPMWRAIRRLRVPVLLHVLDLWPDNVLSSDLLRTRRTARGIANAIHRWNAHMYRAADHVAAISPGILQLLEYRGVPRSKLSYIPMWANEADFYPADGTEFRRSVGVPDDRVVALYAGTLGRTQAIDTFVDGARRYPSDAQPIDIWIAGGGVEQDRIRTALQNMETPNLTTKFLGRVNGEQMASVMAAADVHYVGLRDDANSRITMPSKIQATLACAKPIIIAVSGDAEDAVLSAGAGIRANAGAPDSITNALRSAVMLGRDGLAAMGRQARAAYDLDFSLAAGTTRVENTLHALVGAAQ